ncbi:MAG: hypothetical protein VW709_00515, partial [Rickettsiales bacterium]
MAGTFLDVTVPGGNPAMKTGGFGSAYANAPGGAKPFFLCVSILLHWVRLQQRCNQADLQAPIPQMEPPIYD